MESVEHACADVGPDVGLNVRLRRAVDGANVQWISRMRGRKAHIEPQMCAAQLERSQATESIAQHRSAAAPRRERHKSFDNKHVLPGKIAAEFLHCARSSPALVPVVQASLERTDGAHAGQDRRNKPFL